MSTEGEPTPPSKEDIQRQIEDLAAMIKNLEGKADEGTINELKQKKEELEEELEKMEE